MTSKPMSKYAGLYCPYCYLPVDPNTGDHWVGGCEYERSYRDWVNPQQPVTRLEVLNIELRQLDEQIENNRRERVGLLARIKENENNNNNP